MKAALFALVLGAVSAFGQDDAGMMAAQQASQLAMQAGLQAAQQMQQDMQLAAQASQQAMQQAMQASQQAAQQMADTPSPYSWPVVGKPLQPSFSVKSGKVKAGTTVRIKWRAANNYAAVYYTTDGWTPTTASTLYTGPIPINATTELQAIALSVNRSLSPIAHADYAVPGPIAPIPPLALPVDGVLHAGTRLHLVTNSEVNSKTAHAGDALSVLLDQDVKAGDVVVIPKGTPVAAVLTVAKPAGRYSVPGDLAFEVRSVAAQGRSIPVRGGETLEGEASWKLAEAEIVPGMPFTVKVAADTPLKP